MLHFMPTLLLGLLFSSCLPDIDAHAVLLKPPARNYVAFTECLGGVDCPSIRPTCPQDGTRKVGCQEHNYCSLQSGGPDKVLARGGKWPSPVGSHGLCGDPVQTRAATKKWQDEPYMYKTPPQATYTAGDIIEIEVGVCAEHQGMYVFRICDKPLDSENFETQQAAEDCLNKWYLKRAPPGGAGGDKLPIDEKHPERWYIPLQNSAYYDANNATPVADANWVSDRDFKQWMHGDDTTPEALLQQRRLNVPTSSHKMRMIVPEGLSCTHCTLQWWWVSGNNCAYDADYNNYFKRNSLPGASGKVCSSSFTGEEFWNCADIAVKPKPGTGDGSSRRRSKPSSRRRSNSSTRRRSSNRRRRRRRRRSARRRSGPSTRRRSKPSTRRRSKPSGPAPTSPPTPAPPFPPGCTKGCKDENSGCTKESCNWGDYWQGQCKKTCGGCKLCVPAPTPSAPPTPPPTPPPDTSTRRRRRRGSNPSTRRRSKPTTPPETTKEPRYLCQPSSGFKGEVSKYKDGSFCKCDYGGGSGCSFICGGTKPNHGGNCGPEACTDKLVEFDDKNTYIINVKKSEGGSGSPYRAFAYMKGVKVPSTTTMSFTFKMKKHNAVYSKIFFWGDGNNILGLKPPGSAGGSSQFCFMPSTDAPLSMVKCEGGTMECKPDTWYRVDMELSPPSTIALSIDDKPIGSGIIQGFSGMPMIGVYHWAGGQNGGTPEDYQLFFRDMCLGSSKLTGR